MNKDLNLKPFLDAAEAGDIDGFRACICQDEEALKRFDEAELIDTPLHIAAHRGHVKFAMAMLYLKPSYGKKLNKEMYSPMHIAVQNGLENLVCALLRIDKDLVRLKGKEGYTALHCAAEKGDTELLVLFLKDCPACIEDVTTENETALHVAAKNGKWEALEILARFLQRTHLYCTAVSKRYILEIKDVKGNTVLHIAASNAQPEMVELILECSSTKIKDEKNIHGRTALELLPQQSKILEHERRNVCQNYVKEMVNDFIPYIKQNICSAHNSWWAPILKVICPIECSSSEENVSLNLRATVYERNITRVTVGMANQSADQINAVLVVLALILTATYQALLTPPGGVWQGDVDKYYNASRANGPVGRSVMDNLSFGILYWLNFVVFNVTAFFAVFFLYVLSKNSAVVMLAEVLLSLLIGCILVALLVIKPSGEDSGPKVKAAVCLSSIVSFFVMEVTRNILMFIFNPPIIKSFRKLFLEIQNKF